MVLGVDNQVQVHYQAGKTTYFSCGGSRTDSHCQVTVTRSVGDQIKIISTPDQGIDERGQVIVAKPEDQAGCRNVPITNMVAQRRNVEQKSEERESSNDLTGIVDHFSYR